MSIESPVPCPAVSASVPLHTFGQRVRVSRQVRGLSLREFAEVLSVTPQYISLLEMQKSPRLPGRALLQKMAGVLGVTVSQLLGEVPLHLDIY
jgi:transcriptional regulator with XRE-family HTH domain